MISFAPEYSSERAIKQPISAVLFLFQARPEKLSDWQDWVKDSRK